MKWRSVMANASESMPTTVVINAAEGEPSTFKDRTILRNNPYRVLEGAFVACAVVGATQMTVCLKESFAIEWARVREALDEMTAAGWTNSVEVRMLAGPSAYLFGEETALLEVVDGRQPFPRVTPPWRRGLDEPGVDGHSGIAELATPAHSTAAPALVNNVETFANVTLIVERGPDWFREVGTAESPGTVVCTIVGDVQRHGVGEFAMGTPLSTVITELGGGAAAGRRVIGVLPGASSAVITEDHLDVPLTHEGFTAVGSALGSAGFRCIDDAADLFALTHSASRFLSVESCGQCTPCKDDGLAITSLLTVLMGPSVPDDLDEQLADRLATVANEARCSLATQQQVVVGSLLRMCVSADEPARIAAPSTRTDIASLLVPLLDIVDGAAVYDTEHLRKQPDWTYEATDSGTFPAQRLQGQPVELKPPVSSSDPSLGDRVTP